jgi:2-polyprenyl-3-methyl-5-hydroxy-6-metoxy-1,4-benzoquinol methylase
MPSGQFTSCLLCNSSDLKKLKGYEKDFLTKCTSCGFVFCTQIPSLDELIAHYNGYPRTNQISEITLKRYSVLLDQFEPYRKNNNIIDVGCGDGFFLQVAKEKGWNVYGTEFTDRAMEICTRKGINMMKGELNEHNYAQGFFDIVTSFEVIEHINNPNIEIAKFNKILRTGGIAYVTTPNFNSISRNLLKGQWNIIEYPEHLSYYTKSTLTKLFKAHGFKNIKTIISGISIDRIRQGLQKKQDPVQKKSDEGLRQKTESNFLFKLLVRTINLFLNVSGKGDALKIFFVKIK